MKRRASRMAVSRNNKIMQVLKPPHASPGTCIELDIQYRCMIKMKHCSSFEKQLLFSRTGGCQK